MKRFTLIGMILLFAMSACELVPKTGNSAPDIEPTATDTLPPAGRSEPASTSTNTPPPTATDTPPPPLPHYDVFVSQISQINARVKYSPQVINQGDKFTAAIFLPIETPGAHGLPFSDVYDITVEVYTHGATEFEPGQYTGTTVTFTGDDLSGTSEEGFLIVKWYNPTYSADISYIYLFNIYPKASASRAKLARLLSQSDDPLQTITISGLPNLEDQVVVKDWPDPSPQGVSEDSGGAPAPAENIDDGDGDGNGESDGAPPPPPDDGEITPDM
jgi:hypothetical protein